MLEIWWKCSNPSVEFISDIKLMPSNRLDDDGLKVSFLGSRDDSTAAAAENESREREKKKKQSHRKCNNAFLPTISHAMLPSKWQ